MLPSTTQTPFNWIKNEAGLEECHYQAQRGDVILGTIEIDETLFNRFVCKVNTGLIDDIKVIEKRFGNYDYAREFVESAGHKTLCTECNELHYGNSFCDCGACLYEHGRSQNDPNYPFFTCEKCGATCFWD